MNLSNKPLLRRVAVFFAAGCASLFAAQAYALDAACETILKASEARIKQASWKSVTQLRDDHIIETIKFKGKFFSGRDGVWAKQTADLDEQERKFVAAAHSGAVNLTDCKLIGEEPIDGIEASVMSMHITVPNAPVLEVLLYIGKADGLPYSQSSVNTYTRYSYKGVEAPKL